MMENDASSLSLEGHGINITERNKSEYSVRSFESDKRSVSSPTSSLHNTRRSISTRNNQRRLQRSQHDIRNRHSTADSINVTGRQIHGSNHGSSPARGREDLSGRKTSLRRPRQRQSRSSPDTHVKDINRGVESRTPLCESSLSDVSIYSANSGQTLTNSDSSQISLKQESHCRIQSRQDMGSSNVKQQSSNSPRRSEDYMYNGRSGRHESHSNSEIHRRVSRDTDNVSFKSKVTFTDYSDNLNDDTDNESNPSVHSDSTSSKTFSSSNLSDTCSSRGTSQDGTSADTSATRTTSETSDSIYDSDTSISSDVTIKSSRDTQGEPRVLSSLRKATDDATTPRSADTGGSKKTVRMMLPGEQTEMINSAHKDNANKPRLLRQKTFCGLSDTNIPPKPLKRYSTCDMLPVDKLKELLDSIQKETMEPKKGSKEAVKDDARSPRLPDLLNVSKAAAARTRTPESSPANAMLTRLTSEDDTDENIKLSQAYKISVVQKLWREFDLEKTLEKYRTTLKAETYIRPKDYSLDCAQQAVYLQRRIRHLTGNDVIRLNDPHFLRQLEEKLTQEYYNDLDRREEERAEQERSRMRKLLLDGVITVKDLKEDKRLWKEYKTKRELLDGGWVNKTRRKRKSASRKSKRSGEGKSISTQSNMSTCFSTSQESLNMSCSSGTTLRSRSDIYRPTSRISLDVTSLAEQVHIAGKTTPRQRPYTAPVHRYDNTTDDLSNDNEYDTNGRGYVMNGREYDDDTISRSSYTMSESGIRAQSAREGIRRNPLMDKLRNAQKTAVLYDIAETVIEPLRQIHLMDKTKRREPKPQKKKMTMAALMR